jgi:dCMP deaminase
MAERFSKLSYAERLKVGAIVVKDNRVISIGYNGTPEGWDNSCEEVVEVHEDGGVVTKTKEEVIHAEANAISKLAKDGESGKTASMFLTHAPCIQCAKLIYGAGINSVYYRNNYRDQVGIDFLNKCNVKVTHVGTGNAD